MLKRNMKNKRGQIDYPIVTFAILVIGILIMGIVFMKIFLSIQAPMSAQFGNMTQGGAIAQTNFDSVMTTTINMWDKVMVFAFFIAVILLFVSAFLIDTHPFWVVLYIFISFMLMLFIPSAMSSVDKIYGDAEMVSSLTHLSWLDYIRTYFTQIVVGIMVISGIIIYGKVYLLGGSQNRR